MKKLTYILLWLFCEIGVVAQTATNVDFEVVGKDIVITYDLDKRADVRIDVYVGNSGYTNSMSFLCNPKSVSGAVGCNISAGKRKKVVWNVTADYDEFSYQYVQVRIHANDIERLVSKNEIYVEANVKFGNYMALGGTVGGYINNVNLEASFFHGLTKSEKIYWCGDDVYPVEATYSPSLNVTGKIGYAFIIGTRMKLTPQVGVNYLKISEDVESGSINIGDGANEASALVDVRLSFAFAKHFAISVSPEYSLCIRQSDGYKALSEVSSDIDNWSNGFNVKCGLSIFF